MNWLNRLRKFLRQSIKMDFEDAEQLLYFICGSEVLPMPLSQEEENECLMALATNEREEACAKLIEHNLRLVIYISKKFENSLAVATLFSDGFIAREISVIIKNNLKNSFCIFPPLLIIFTNKIKKKIINICINFLKTC